MSRKYNAPEGVTVKPKVIILINNYWGKGDGIQDAWKNLRKETGRTMAALKKAPHIIYSCFDYIVAEETNERMTVKSYIGDMGSICYHGDYPPSIIYQHERR